MKKKSILFYSPFNTTHTAYNSLINNPPEGYFFILPKKTFRTNLYSSLQKIKLIKPFYHSIINLFPTTFFLNFFSQELKEMSPKLVFSTNSIYLGKFPWILEILDHPTSLSGNKYPLFLKNLNSIEKSLSSKNCKKIIVTNEVNYQFLKKYFSGEVINKTILIRTALPLPDIKKNYSKKTIQISFFGSINNPDDFYIKGGLYAIEVFSKISKEFKNVQMIIRSKVPREVKKKYLPIPNLKIIESPLSSEKFEKLLRETDICLNPGHIYPLMTTLESLSYGMPLVSLDTKDIRDFVTDKTSILVPPPKDIDIYSSEEYPTNVRYRRYLKKIKKSNPVVVKNIFLSIKKLLLSPELRKSLVEEGRKSIKSKFSIEIRNKKLKKVFDEVYP